MFSAISDIPLFLDRGGWVLWLIFFLCILLMTLLAERGWFFLSYSRQLEHTSDNWRERDDNCSYSARTIRTSWLTREEIALRKHFNLIRTLIMICPLAGLLGTVTGMIGLFSEMGNQGLPDSTLLLTGLTRICLPTLAGLTTALTGLGLFTLCQSAARKHLQNLSKQLPMH